MPKKTDNSGNKEPVIYKEVEFNTMIQLIEAGLWRNVNLAKALHVDDNTIRKWKDRREAIEAHQKAILKFVKRRTDAEKILQELEVEVASDPNTLVQNNYFNLTDEQLDQLIESKRRKIGATGNATGEGEANS